MFFLLLALGVLCSLVGFILFVVAGFRVSMAWGFVALLLPFALSLGADFAGKMTGMASEPWWFWMAQVLFLLPWLILSALHWEKAKNAFMMCVAGLVFYAAAFYSFDTKTKQQMAVWLQATGQPIPPLVADFLEIKKPAGPNDKPAAAGGPSGPANPAGSPPAGPVADSPASPAATGTAALETRDQVLAAVAELNDRAAKLKARKDLLKGSPDQMALNQLAEDIKTFNERLKLVTAREVQLGMIPAPTPTPPPAPAIPTTVVIPASTPAPSPARKK